MKTGQSTAKRQQRHLDGIQFDVTKLKLLICSTIPGHDNLSMLWEWETVGPSGSHGAKLPIGLSTRHGYLSIKFGPPSLLWSLEGTRNECASFLSVYIDVTWLSPKQSRSRNRAFIFKSRCAHAQGYVVNARFFPHKSLHAIKATLVQKNRWRNLFIVPVKVLKQCINYLLRIPKCTIIKIIFFQFRWKNPLKRQGVMLTSLSEKKFLAMNFRSKW